MSDLALDAAGDLLLEQGDAVLATGALATAQDWARRLTLFKGEYSLDRRVGIDYQNLIFNGRASQALLQHIFETVTRETAGVRTLNWLRFSLDGTTRELTVDADVTMDDEDGAELHYSNVLFDKDLGAGAAA